MTTRAAMEQLAHGSQAVATAYESMVREDPDMGPYVAAGALAQVLVEALLEGRMEDLVAVFQPLEEMLSTAQGETRELLIVGLLEGVQDVSLNRDMALDRWIPLLGPTTKEAWDAVDEMWSGRMAPSAFNEFVDS